MSNFFNGLEGPLVMDSFNRDATVYCCASTDKSVTFNDVVATAISDSISADKVNYNGKTVGEALKELNKRMQELELLSKNAATVLSSAFVGRKRLNREDLHLVWNK